MKALFKRCALPSLLCIALLFAMAGCATLEQNVAAGLLGATTLAAQSPNSEIEQRSTTWGYSIRRSNCRP